MDNKKHQKNVEKSIPKRIPNKVLKKIEKRGNGDFRAGLYKMDSICDLVERDPSILLQKELEHFGGLIQAFASENHYEHYQKGNVASFLLKFIKTGRLDTNMINNRVEKPISSFEEDDKEKDK